MPIPAFPVLLVIALLAACAGEPAAGVDARDPGRADVAVPDAGPDAAADAGPEAGPDAGTDANADAGTDLGVDSAGEATGDGPIDAAGEDAADPGVPPDSCPSQDVVPLAHARVPDGYCAWTWASGLSSPRGLEVAGNGDLLVVNRGTSSVLALFDEDGDGLSSAAERVTLAHAPGLNHGIATRDGYLYASSSDTVYRWPYARGARADLGEAQVVVTGIPGGGHVTRTLAFDAEGRLYVSVGSGGNVDTSPSRSLILRFGLAGLPAGGWEASGGEVFAAGLRNEVGLALDDGGRLWGVENGRDELSRADLGGDIHQENPGEEVNLFASAGRFYGYPYCFSEYGLPQGVGRGPGTQWADPGFIGDGTHDDAWCRDPGNVVPPALVMPAHTAPLGITFYRGDAFPADVRGDAFVALHGSWDANPPVGYRVVRLVYEGGSSPRRFEPFLAYEGPGETGADWPHRPVDVRVGPTGILLVSSDTSGVVIAIGHRGP